MPRDVVVLMQEELSDTDAGRVTELHADSGDSVSYHLLMTDGDRAEGASALLGIDRADMFGSPAVARYAGVDDSDDVEARPETGNVVERSAQRLRAAEAGEIDFAIAQADMWSSARSLIRSTGSHEAVVVADTETYPQVSLPDWQHRARDYLAVDTLYVIEHEL